METYPIIIDGETVGTLTEDRQGARTVFDAECRMQPGVVRLSVYGGGKEGYLGVLAPEGGKLRLHKTLSRSQLREFPAKIETAEPSGRPSSSAPAPEGSAHGEAPTPEPEIMTEPEPIPEPSPEPPEEPKPAPEPEPCPELPREAEPEPEPEPCPEPSEEAPAEPEKAKGSEKPKKTEKSEKPEGLSWYASPDGALVCFDGERTLIALPPEDERVPKGIEGTLREIEGKQYLVYPTKDGRIIPPSAPGGKESR